jgi:hypothetical protein
VKGEELGAGHLNLGTGLGLKTENTGEELVKVFQGLMAPEYLVFD